LTRNALEGDGTRTRNKSAWVRLSVLRLIGVVPWSGINIASGVCGVAISDCIFGAFIGSLPWTAVTCQVCLPIAVIFDNILIAIPDWGHSANCSLYTFTHATDRVISLNVP
jgi:hypothetical protein